MPESPPSCIDLARHLESLLSQGLAKNPTETWKDIELTAQNLANRLRVKDSSEDNHTALGNTSLPQTLTSLLKSALNGAAIPDSSHEAVVFEIFRVAANLCMDHDENRGHLLEANFPQAIVSLLEGYSENLIQDYSPKPLPLSIPHLKIIRTAIGVLLNASIGFDAVKFRLISLEAAATILKLSTAIYPPGSWLTESALISSQDAIIEEWTLRCGLSNWAWRTISELKDVKDDSRQIFGPDILPLIVMPLLAFIPPYPKASSDSFFARDSSLRTSLLQTDFDILEESCMLIESLSLDVEDVRLSLARGLNFPAEHGGVPCLCGMLDFIEKGDHHPLWYEDGTDEGERKRREKSFAICKAAVIKAVVEVAGEEKNEDVLWDDCEENPGGEFVCKMVEWVKAYVTQKEERSTHEEGSEVVTEGRDDLVICASLSLGNLARREKHASTLLSPPHSLAPVLSSPHVLSPSTDIKLKHGIIGLLKHLAQSSPHSPSIQATLNDAGVVQRLAASGVWDQKTDAMAEVVQMGAIGVVKHMCNASVDSTFALVLPSPNQELAATGLSQILTLVRRSDSVPIKSEGTRVLVNVIKSLWSSNVTTNAPTSPTSPSLATPSDKLQDTQRKKQEAMQLVLKPDYAMALASLVGRSGKYPLLVNEGTVALSLLSTNKDGAPLVLNAITSPLPLEAIPGTTSTSASASTASSPVVTSPTSRMQTQRSALDMLVSALKNVDTGSNIPVEVRANVCSLIGQVGRHATGGQLAKIKESTMPILQELADKVRGAGREGLLGAAAQRVLDGWAA